MDSISAKKATISKDFFAAQQTSSLKLDTSQQMWEYKNRNKLNGFPVSQNASNLYVNNIEELKEALQPVYNIKVWTGYLSPQKQDERYVQEYRDLIQANCQSTIAILDESKHFRPDIGKIMLIITYAEVKMQLNPRYEHLKQE